VLTSILAAAELFLFLALANSVIRFLHAAFAEAEGSDQRLLAAVSSATTLVAVSTIYSGRFAEDCDRAVRHWTDDSRAIRTADRVLIHIDDVCTSIANALNPSKDVGFRPHPTFIPFAIIGCLYIIRWLIYVSATRKRLRYAAITGSVYWSHITAYVGVVSFLVVIANWDVALVIGASLLLIVLLVVGLMGVFQDALFVIRGGIASLWKLIKGLGGSVARASLTVARTVRIMVERAHELYRIHISTPLRKATDTVVDASARFEERSKEKLAEENQRHRDRFDKRRRRDED
jgi:hypothetical protein